MIFVQKIPYYPAPAPDNLIGMNVDSIKENMQDALPEEAAACHHFLGTLYLSQSKLKEAVESFEYLFCSESFSKYTTENTRMTAQSHCNYGVALQLSDKLKAAREQFEKAAVLWPQGFIIQYNLALMHRKLHNLSRSKRILNRLVKSHPKEVLGYLALADLYISLKQESSALRYYKEALICDPDNTEASNYLGRQYFISGKKLFKQGKIEDAFREWAKGDRKFPDCFEGDQNVVLGMKSLVADYNAKNGIEQLFSTLKDDIARQHVERTTYHNLFSCFLFSLGLMPRAYVELEAVDEDLEQWNTSIQQRGDHPYAYYRIALIHCCLGKLESALESLAYCEDNLSKSKIKGLKLPELIRFVRKLYRLQMLEDSRAESLEAEQEWRNQGFSNSSEVTKWRESGLTAEMAKMWKDKGFSAEHAGLWSGFKLDPEKAGHWKDEGFVPDKPLKPWILAGVEPRVARAWIDEFEKEEALAIQCIAVGFKDPREANAWLGIFSFPSEAEAWKANGFSPEEAALWLEKGISDPYMAKRAIEQ